MNKATLKRNSVLLSDDNNDFRSKPTYPISPD